MCSLNSQKCPNNNSELPNNKGLRFFYVSKNKRHGSFMKSSPQLP